MNGYFKVHRKILESQVFAHQTALKIWIWCLARVTYKEHFIAIKVGRGETIVKLIPGQFIFGRFKAEEELNIDGSTIYKWMQKFASPEFEMITIDSNNQYSIITICKWDEYQYLDYEEVTTKEQQSNSQVDIKELACSTYKKDNNDNNDNKINIPFEVFWNLYDIKVDRQKCEVRWGRMTDTERTTCIEKIPEYINGNPDKKYRRHPKTYLNSKSWENEVVKSNGNVQTSQVHVKPLYTSGPGR